MASPRCKSGCSSKRVKLNKKDDRNAKMSGVKLSDVMCPVCLCILIEPVTMPCHHNLCMPCFQQNVRETSLLCPICRKRISSWARKASRENALVNQVLWKSIQNAFPDKVKRRQLGTESDPEEDNSDEEMHIPPVKISKPGEIRKEYEIQLKRLHEEDEKEREWENRKSSALIKVIQEEEERLRIETQKQAEKDHLIALLITDQIQEVPVKEETKVVNSVLSNIKEVLRPASISTVDARPPALVKSRRSASSSAIPRPQSFGTKDKKASYERDKDDGCKGNSRSALCNENPGKSTGKLSRSNSLDSEDSITPELRHFRPIKTAPKTPPLRLPDGRIQETPLIHATPRALVFDLHVCESDRRDLLRKRLAGIEEDRRKRFEGGINMDRTDASQSIRKQNLFRTLAPFSTSPGNCALGAKPEKKYALSDLAANKENPKTTTRKRKLQDNSTKTEISKKQKAKLGYGDVNVPQKLHPKSQTPGHLSESQVLTTKRSSKLPPPRLQVSKFKSQRRDPDDEARKSQEEADRLLALELHRELNCKHNAVDRRSGTKGEYFLRSRDNEVSFQSTTGI